MINYEFIGWNNDDGADKVWGMIVLLNPNAQSNETTYATFWGRRGKKLQSKVQKFSRWDAQKLIDSKMNKGYREIYKDDINNVYPEFEKDLQKMAVWNMLKAS